MKLNRTRRLLLACALLPLTVRGAEPPIEPLWELQIRFGGMTSPTFSRNIEELLGASVPKQVSTSNTVLRVAGFANDLTPEKDWIAEIRGIQGIEKILATDKLGPKCAVWSDDSETILLAGPATNKGQAIKEMVLLEDADWLSGWIDFDKLDDANIHSKLLKLTEKLSFTITGTEDVMTLIMCPRFDSVATATAVPAWLAQFSDLLRKAKVNLPTPPTVCEIDGATVTLRMEFKGEDFRQLCGALKKVIAQKPEANSSDPGH
jgi:hypothetical protein